MNDIPVLQHPPIKDIKTVVNIYWNYPEIGVKQIKELFNLSSDSCGHKLKRKVLNEMSIRDMKTHTKGTVNTRFAFDCWGLDISDLEKRLAKINKVKDVKTCPDKQ